MNIVAETIFFYNIVDRVGTFVVQTAVVAVYDHGTGSLTDGWVNSSSPRWEGCYHEVDSWTNHCYGNRIVINELKSA